MTTILAVDGNSLAHRAHHAYERSGMRNKAGEPVWAVYGFLTLLIGICDKANPDAILVGFDDHTSSERKARCPEYKAQRSAKSPELYEQMETIMRILPKLGIPVVVPPGLEADDVVGSTARAAEEAGWKCVVATSDRDSFNLITESTTVLRLGNGLDSAIMLTPEGLYEKYGVRPAQYLQYAALRGDASDNLPGVKGIGEKGAAKLLEAFPSIQAAVDAPLEAAKVIGKANAARLVSPEAAVALKRNLDIMLIRKDVPINIETARISINQETVRTVLEEAELPNLVRRLTLVLCDQTGSSWDSVLPAPTEGDFLDGNTAEFDLEPEESNPFAEPASSNGAPKESSTKVPVRAAANQSLLPMGEDLPLPTTWPLTMF